LITAVGFIITRWLTGSVTTLIFVIIAIIAATLRHDGCRLN
jgi:hypothetical protein